MRVRKYIYVLIYKEEYWTGYAKGNETSYTEKQTLYAEKQTCYATAMKGAKLKSNIFLYTRIFFCISTSTHT